MSAKRPRPAGVPPPPSPVTRVEHPVSYHQISSHLPIPYILRSCASFTRPKLDSLCLRGH